MSAVRHETMKVDEQSTLPAALRAQYYQAGHWRSEDLWTSFATVVAGRPHATALIDGDRQVSFADLQREAERFSDALQEQGVTAGQVVAVHGRHCVESAIAILGCAHAGVVVALLPHMFSTEQIRAILDNSEARALVALGEPAEVARAQEATRGRQLAAFIVADPARAAEAPPDRTAVTWSAFLASGDARKASHQSAARRCTRAPHVLVGHDRRTQRSDAFVEYRALCGGDLRPLPVDRRIGHEPRRDGVRLHR